MPSDGDLGNLAFGEYVIDRADERVLGPDGPVRLGQKAYRVLLLLAEQDGRLVTKDALFSSVWDGTIVSESSLTSAIKELRRALGDESRTPRFIESVYGRGYRLIARVSAAGSTAPSGASGAARRTGGDPAAAAAGRPPLVLVTAFHDEAVRDRHPWYAAELREEVLSGLARFREIQLVSDNRTEEEAAKSGEQERGYLLTATLLPAGDGVKVIARAKRLADGRILWAETMSLADTGMAGGVERIVRRIAGAALPAVDEDLLHGLPHDTDDIYDRYLLAKRLSMTSRSYVEAKQAAAALERIIAERPGFALAYPPLVRLYNIDFGYTGLGSSGDAERSRALELAKTGLTADRGNVHAYTVLGFSHLWNNERAMAANCMETAETLNPYNPVRLEDCATFWMYMGDLARARALMDKAFELNPAPDQDIIEDMGRLQLVEGDAATARTTLASMVGGTIWSPLYLGIAELRLGLDSWRERLGHWQLRVREGWHNPPPPTGADIYDWIRRHHPFTRELGDRLFDGVRGALIETEPVEGEGQPSRRPPANLSRMQ